MARWPLRMAWKPLMRSQEREFILCGMAEEPVWPGANPSEAVSWPAMRRRVLAKEEGPLPSSTREETTEKSRERG